jgi:y4mF family transcriptional regulator
MIQTTKVQKLGQLIRNTRKQQGLTQQQLAAFSGSGVRFIRELEQGKESCHIGKALTVLAMLGLIIQVDGEPL